MSVEDRFHRLEMEQLANSTAVVRAERSGDWVTAELLMDRNVELELELLSLDLN